MNKNPIINHISVKIELTKNFPNYLDQVGEFTKELCLALDLKIVTGTQHEFSPKGVTLVYILSQSHIAVHTWPEYKLIHIDLVTCVVLDKQRVEKILTTMFANSLQSIEIKEI